MKRSNVVVILNKALSHHHRMHHPPVVIASRLCCAIIETFAFAKVPDIAQRHKYKYELDCFDEPTRQHAADEPDRVQICICDPIDFVIKLGYSYEIRRCHLSAPYRCRATGIVCQFINIIYCVLWVKHFTTLDVDE